MNVLELILLGIICFSVAFTSSFLVNALLNSRGGRR